MPDLFVFSVEQAVVKACDRAGAAGFVIDWDAQNGLGDINTNIGITAASGVDYSQSFAAAVPAPGMMLMFALGVGGLCVVRWKHRAGRNSA